MKGGTSSGFYDLYYLHMRDHRHKIEKPELRDVLGYAKIKSSTFEEGVVREWAGDGLALFLPLGEGKAQGGVFADDAYEREITSTTGSASNGSSGAQSGGVGVWGGGVIPVVTYQGGARASFDQDRLDARYKALKDVTNQAGGTELEDEGAAQYRTHDGFAVPGGVAALLAAGTNEYQQESVLYAFKPLVAQHRGDGPPQFSTPVFEINGTDLDFDRFAGLHTAWRVAFTPWGEQQLAWNLAQSTGDDTGYGAYMAPGDASAAPKGDPRTSFLTAPPGGSGLVGALAVWDSPHKSWGGPFHPGHATKDKHKIGVDPYDGIVWNDGHLWIDSLFYKNQKEDGPLNHTFFEQGVSWPFPTVVQFGWNDPIQRWDWWTTVPFSAPIPGVPFRPGTPVIVPTPIPKDLGGGGGGRGGGAVVTGGGLDDPGAGKATGKAETGWKPTDLGNGTPASPMGTPYELALPSVMFKGHSSPAQPPDDRFKPGTQPGHDFAPSDIARAGAGLTQAAAQYGVRRGTGRHVAADNADYNAAIESGTGEVDVGADNETRRRAARAAGYAPVGAPQAHFERLGHPAPLTEAAESRGGPFPLAAHLYALQQVNASGENVYKSRPGEVWGPGTAAKAALVLQPGGVLPDGPADQSTWAGALDFLLSTGAGFSGTSQTRFGWAQWDRATGDWYNGAVLTPSAADNADLSLDFRDTAGAARSGLLDINGITRTDDGSAATPAWSFGGDTDTGIYRGGANQLNFSTSGTLRARINTAALAPAGSGLTLGALSDPWAAAYITALVPGTLFPAKASPAQITADQNDYALPAATVVRLDTDASRTLTGLDATSNADRLVLIVNVGANPLVLANQNAGSTAANRIITGTGADLTVAADGSCWVWYDSTTARWRVK